jgi:hypothetical protein
MTDRSTVGLYFASQSDAHEMLALPIMGAPAAAAADRTVTFSQPLSEDVDAIALVPEQVPANIVLSADAVLPNGTRTPIIKLNTRADWVRRYWFASPIALPRGTRINVVAKLDDPDLLSTAFAVGSAPKPVPSAPIRLRLDVIPVRGATGAQ